jgi:hypothetical protein
LAATSAANATSSTPRFNSLQCGCQEWRLVPADTGDPTRKFRLVGLRNNVDPTHVGSVSHINVSHPFNSIVAHLLRELAWSHLGL